jgi:hypothetical protein
MACLTTLIDEYRWRKLSRLATIGISMGYEFLSCHYRSSQP